MNWVYKQTEPHVYTVGFHDPNGKFHTDSDWDNKYEASRRVRFLNGGGPSPVEWVPAMEALVGFAEAQGPLSINPVREHIKMARDLIAQTRGFRDWTDYLRNAAELDEIARQEGRGGRSGDQSD